ncbi:MAG: hypothetical protein HOE90_05380 [Bacteriovoracaceae bacterium]|nr:hypothetical protein [Bacteriovoracaceae bacterium]
MKDYERVIYEGSVKTVRGLKGGSPVYFEFSDDFSVFDWGKMPDSLGKKGAALSSIAHQMFKYLSDPIGWDAWIRLNRVSLREMKVSQKIMDDLSTHGQSSHFLEIIGSEFGPLLKVKGAEVRRPRRESPAKPYEYGSADFPILNRLLPLEVIFRTGCPKGSSLLKRSSDLPYLKSIGLTTPPKEGESFEYPIVEFSTKLEDKDRYLDKAQAKKISHLDDDDFFHLESLVKVMALRLKDFFSELGLTLWDGKFEFSYSKYLEKPALFVLVDSIGPDELRITKDGIHLSKEYLRQYYKLSTWSEKIAQAQSLSKELGLPWQKVMEDKLMCSPPLLEKETKKLASQIYTVLDQLITQKIEGAQIDPKILSDLVHKLQKNQSKWSSIEGLS